MCMYVIPMNDHSKWTTKTPIGASSMHHALLMTTLTNPYGHHQPNWNTSNIFHIKSKLYLFNWIIVKISNFKSFLQIAKNHIGKNVHFFKTAHAFYTKTIKNTLQTIMLSFSYFPLKSPYWNFFLTPSYQPFENWHFFQLVF